MKYWYCYIPAMLALLPLLLSTICDCIADSAKQRAARKNPPKQRPEIISAADTPAPTPAADTPAPKRGRGRPRKYPPADPAAPKRKRGRPRKNPPTQRAEIISADDTPAAAPANAPAAPAAPTPAAETPAPALPLLLPTLDPIVYTPDSFAAMIAA